MDGADVTTAMTTASRPEITDRDQAAPRSSLRDQALLTLYIVIVAVSMGGWLWFLGSASWRLASWAMH